MNTTTFTVTITGIPAKAFNEFCEKIKFDILRDMKIIFDPSNIIEVSYHECEELGLQPFYDIVGNAMTMKCLQDEIKNGN